MTLTCANTNGCKLDDGLKKTSEYTTSVLLVFTLSLWSRRIRCVNINGDGARVSFAEIRKRSQ